MRLALVGSEVIVRSIGNKTACVGTAIGFDFDTSRYPTGIKSAARELSPPAAVPAEFRQ